MSGIGELKPSASGGGPRFPDSPVRWRSRGLGLDAPPDQVRATCFVCGTNRREPGANSYMHNLSAFIAGTDEGQALACFERGAWMGYYHGDRDVPQIKVTACTAHVLELELISDQWFITPALIAQTAKRGVDRVAFLLEHPPEDRTEARWLSYAAGAVRKVRLPHKYELDRESADEIAATIRWELAVAELL